MKVPVVNAAIALVAHILLLLALMLFFRLNIYAVVISNAFFALLMCFLNARALARYSGYRQEVVKTFIIPAICSLIMGVITFFVYKGLFALTKIVAISLIISIIVAVIVYAVTLLLLKGLTEEEIRKFPKGALIIKIARKVHLL